MKNIRLVLLMVLILACMVSYSHAAGDFEQPVYLVVMTMTSTGDSEFTFNYHKVLGMSACFNIVNNSRVSIPTAGDAEAAVALYCAPTKAKVWDFGEMRK